MDDMNWLAPTITSLSVLVVAVLGAWRSGKNGREIAAVKADTATVKADAATIVAHTNGTLTAATAAKDAAEHAREVLLERVDGLERQLAAVIESGSLARVASIQAATDVREAQAVMPPGHDAAGGEG